MFDELVDGQLKWNISYGPSITYTDHLSMLLRLEMITSDDGFDYFVLHLIIKEKVWLLI
jgi:hypothetical protein